jgi:hypothetical protein
MEDFGLFRAGLRNRSCCYPLSPEMRREVTGDWAPHAGRDWTTVAAAGIEGGADCSGCGGRIVAVNECTLMFDCPPATMSLYSPCSSKTTSCDRATYFQWRSTRGDLHSASLAGVEGGEDGTVIAEVVSDTRFHHPMVDVR